MIQYRQSQCYLRKCIISNAESKLLTGTVRIPNIYDVFLGKSVDEHDNSVLIVYRQQSNQIKPNRALLHAR